jgi:hypothetical protein
MKFEFVNPHNVAWNVPHWAMDPFDCAVGLEDLLGKHFAGRVPGRWDRSIDFWIEFTSSDKGFATRIATPDSVGHKMMRGLFVIDTPEWQIVLPLNDLLKGSPKADGQHSVYFHSFDTETPLGYIGITKQRWFDRLSQHESAARTGSPYLFHRALRDHAGLKISHRVLLGLLDYDLALEQEEKWVAMFGLYPLGLNMIPGGRAGIAYLAKLGFNSRSAAEKDVAVEGLSARESISGRPNPLCAARWAADPDFAERVICGHSGRLTAQQVRHIRLLVGTGRSYEEVADLVGDRRDRVASVVLGKTYARICA